MFASMTTVTLTLLTTPSTLPVHCSCGFSALANSSCFRSLLLSSSSILSLVAMDSESNVLKLTQV